MKKQIVMVTGAFIVTSLFSGCATIVSGKTQKVKFISEKPVKITVDNKTSTTPATIEIKRENSSKIVTAECENKTKQIILKRKVNPWFAGNLIFGGALGSTTDYVSGAMWEYDDIVNVDCK